MSIVLTFDPWRNWSRIGNLTEMKLQQQFLDVMYSPNRMEKESIPGASLLAEFSTIRGRGAEKRIRIWASFLTKSLFVTIPGTQDASDVVDDLNFSVRTLLTGNRGHAGVEDNFESYEVTYLNINIVGNAAALGPNGASVMKSTLWTIYGNGDPDPVFEKNYARVTLRETRWVNGPKLLYVNMCELIYAYLIALNEAYVFEDSIFPADSPLRKPGSPKSIRILGHSLGGGMAQMLEDQLSCESFIVKRSPQWVNAWYGFISYDRPAWWPQVMSVVFGGLPSLSDDINSRIVPVLNTDTVGDKDFITIVVPLTLKAFKYGKQAVSNPVSLAEAGFTTVGGALGVNQKITRAAVKTVEFVDSVGSRFQRKLGIKKPVKTSSLILKAPRLLNPVSIGVKTVNFVGRKLGADFDVGTVAIIFAAPTDVVAAKLVSYGTGFFVTQYESVFKIF